MSELSKEMIAMRKINVELSPQVRVTLSEDTIIDYQNVLAEQEKFPPIDLFWSEQHNVYLIGDGIHRFYAYSRNNEAFIEANVHQGGEREAMLFALSANKKHGLRRSKADLRRAVTIVLKDVEWMGWSNPVIAQNIGCSIGLIDSVRKELKPDIADPPDSERVKKTRSESGQDGEASSSPSVEEPKWRKGQDGKRRRTTQDKAKPAEKPAAGGKEAISPEMRKEAKTTFAAFYRAVKKVPAWKELLEERLESIAEDMKVHWSRGGK